MFSGLPDPYSEQSTSAWGSELKYTDLQGSEIKPCLPLREVVSWNKEVVEHGSYEHSLPLREVVSWNTTVYAWTAGNMRLPLREVVSWNIILIPVITMSSRLPLREVVSWNFLFSISGFIASLSTSAWGSELKCHCISVNCLLNTVYLCVR